MNISLKIGLYVMHRTCFFFFYHRVPASLMTVQCWYLYSIQWEVTYPNMLGPVGVRITEA